MQPIALPLRLLAAIGIASIAATSTIAQSTEAPGATTGQSEQSGPPANASNPNSEWPCDQPLRPEMSIGAMWSGPDPNAGSKNWREIPTVAAMVSEIAPRRTPQEEAVANVRRFAAGYHGEERTQVLTQLFAGLFETLSAERNDIVRGIKRFYRRQDALAHRIEEGWKQLGDIDPNATDPKVAEQRAALQQQVDWDGRIFDDRQRLLPAVCEQPRVLEQRVFALSRAIQEQLAADH
ncbi:MAG TPA: hypothetical protein VFE34_17885 [Dongiaceae bacterium]|nr:hypothetical protein [Dongiaceae bacterium]